MEEKGLVHVDENGKLNKPPMAVYRKLIEEEKFHCRWCTHLIKPEYIQSYDHDGGYDVEGYNEKQWIYFECPNCKYQWSLSKIIRMNRQKG